MDVAGTVGRIVTLARESAEPPYNQQMQALALLGSAEQEKYLDPESSEP